MISCLAGPRLTAGPQESRFPNMEEAVAEAAADTIRLPNATLEYMLMKFEMKSIAERVCKLFELQEICGACH